MTNDKHQTDSTGLVCQQTKGPMAQETCHPETYQGYQTGSMPIIEWAATFMVLLIIVGFVLAFSIKEPKR